MIKIYNLGINGFREHAGSNPNKSGQLDVPSKTQSKLMKLVLRSTLEKLEKIFKIILKNFSDIPFMESSEN